jgi:hypothetical protein
MRIPAAFKIVRAIGDDQDAARALRQHERARLRECSGMTPDGYRERL